MSEPPSFGCSGLPAIYQVPRATTLPAPALTPEILRMLEHSLNTGLTELVGIAYLTGAGPQYQTSLDSGGPGSALTANHPRLPCHSIRLPESPVQRIRFQSTSAPVNRHRLRQPHAYGTDLKASVRPRITLRRARSRPTVAWMTSPAPAAGFRDQEKSTGLDRRKRILLIGRLPGALPAGPHLAGPSLER